MKWFKLECMNARRNNCLYTSTKSSRAWTGRCKHYVLTKCIAHKMSTQVNITIGKRLIYKVLDQKKLICRTNQTDRILLISLKKNSQRKRSNNYEMDIIAGSVTYCMNLSLLLNFIVIKLSEMLKGSIIVCVCVCFQRQYIFKEDNNFQSL